jgi:hypothetical protein
MSRITDFYFGKTTRPHHSIEQVWNYSYGELEYVHTYIQWLFPLLEASQAMPGSPILSNKDIEMFEEIDELKQRLLKSFQVMLRFYGFSLRYDPEPVIEPTDEFEERAEHWLNANNHNHLRITRILRSLTLLGLAKEAREFFAALQRVYIKNPDKIGSYSYDYWKRAIK